MTRGEIQAFIASLHTISAELESVKDEVPEKVHVELSAMENVLRRELSDDLCVNRFRKY